MIKYDLVLHEKHRKNENWEPTTQTILWPKFFFTILYMDLRRAALGICYTIRFNVSQYPSFTGPENGLRLTLLTQNEEYMHRMSPSSGFKVEIHDSRMIPIPEDKGFTISPGFETSVGIRRLYLSVRLAYLQN